MQFDIIFKMKNSLNRILSGLAFAVLGILLFSCVPQKKILYLQDMEGAKPQSLFANPTGEYRVRPGDYLYVRIFSMDKDANEIFSDMSGVSTFNLTDQNIFLNSYMVNDSGYINFPLLGKIKAGGLPIQDIEKELYELTLKDVNNPGVVVRLVNFKITIVGEVKNPGTFYVYQNSVNLFQALSMAGDLTTYSNRSAIKLLRKQGDQTVIINIDLTKKEILTSDYYYLRPGDVLYIEPLKYKQYAFEAFPYALILTSLSTVLALLTFFKI